MLAEKSGKIIALEHSSTKVLSIKVLSINIEFTNHRYNGFIFRPHQTEHLHVIMTICPRIKGKQLRQAFYLDLLINFGWPYIMEISEPT